MKEKKSNNPVIITAQIPKNLSDILRETAASEERSVSHIIRRLLLSHPLIVNSLEPARAEKTL